MSLLYLVRHGQASFNAERYDQLSPLGIEQAELTGRYLARHAGHVECLMAGPRQRQRQTADAIAGEVGHAAEIEIVEELDEFADGEIVLAAAQARYSIPDIHALPHTDRMRYYQRMIAEWVAGDASLPGRPTADVFRATATAWLHTFRKKADRNSRAVAVTSAGTIAALTCEALGLPTTAMISLLQVIENASVSEFLHTPTRIGLRCFNVAAHLPADRITAI